MQKMELLDTRIMTAAALGRVPALMVVRAIRARTTLIAKPMYATRATRAWCWPRTAAVVGTAKPSSTVAAACKITRALCRWLSTQLMPKPSLAYIRPKLVHCQGSSVLSEKATGMQASGRHGLPLRRAISCAALSSCAAATSCRKAAHAWPAAAVPHRLLANLLLGPTSHLHTSTVFPATLCTPLQHIMLHLSASLLPDAAAAACSERAWPLFRYQQ